jgi:hypothetical protein
MKNFLLQLNNKTLKNLGIMVLGGVVIVGLFLSASPIIKSNNERNIETSRLNNELAQTTAKIGEYSAMKGQKEALDSTSQYLMDKFPEASDVPGLLQDINAAAIKIGLSPNFVNNITVGTPTQVVEPLGVGGESVCNSLTPGEFAKIIPDLKNSTVDSKIYIMCTEKPIEKLGNGAFYNAATDNAARNCKFGSDAASGQLFYIKVECDFGTVLPALSASSVNVTGEVGRFPARNILAQVTGEVAQMQVTISLDSSVNINLVSKFVNELYGMQRALSISSVKVGMSNDRNGVAYTVINGYAYSHTAIISGDSVNGGDK